MKNKVGQSCDVGKNDDFNSFAIFSNDGHFEF